MLKKKNVISVVLAFCLTAVIFPGVTISQDGTLESTTPQKGYLSIPAAAFTPYDHNDPFHNHEARIAFGLYTNEVFYEDVTAFFAPVQLPQGVTVTNVTVYWYHESFLYVKAWLWRYNQTGKETMTFVNPVGTPLGFRTDYMYGPIDYAIVDNSRYSYTMEVWVPNWGDLEAYYFQYAVVEYEYPKPPITPETRFQDASIWVNQSLLPGLRVNLFAQNEYEITQEDITHVCHGVVTERPWSEMSEEEKTAFLSTNEFHLYINDEEVPLTHITRHDSLDDKVWSLYYRVFPPGYFEANRVHRLRGEWYLLNYMSGEWDAMRRGGTLRVRP